MDNAEFDRSIADRLGRGTSRDDLLLEICGRNGVDWEGAEDYLTKLEGTYYKRIDQRKNTLFLLISLAMLGEGGLQAGFGLYAFYPTISVFLTHPDSPLALEIMLLLFSPTGIIMLSGLAIFGSGMVGTGIALRKLVGKLNSKDTLSL